MLLHRILIVVLVLLLAPSIAAARGGGGGHGGGDDPRSTSAASLREGAHEAQRRYQCERLGGSTWDGIDQPAPKAGGDKR